MFDSKGGKTSATLFTDLVLELENYVDDIEDFLASEESDTDCVALVGLRMDGYDIDATYLVDSGCKYVVDYAAKTLPKNFIAKLNSRQTE